MINWIRTQPLVSTADRQIAKCAESKLNAFTSENTLNWLQYCSVFGVRFSSSSHVIYRFAVCVRVLLRLFRSTYAYFASLSAWPSFNRVYRQHTHSTLCVCVYPLLALNTTAPANDWNVDSHKNRWAWVCHWCDVSTLNYELSYANSREKLVKIMSFSHLLDSFSCVWLWQFHFSSLDMNSAGRK